MTTPITSWNDLWREDLAGSLSLPGITTTAGPMVVMKAGEHAGVDAFADDDAAFAAVEELKPNVVKNYNTGSELINLFSTGEITRRRSRRTSPSARSRRRCRPSSGPTSRKARSRR